MLLFGQNHNSFLAIPLNYPGPFAILFDQQGHGRKLEMMLKKDDVPYSLSNQHNYNIEPFEAEIHVS